MLLNRSLKTLGSPPAITTLLPKDKEQKLKTIPASDQNTQIRIKTMTKVKSFKKEISVTKDISQDTLNQAKKHIMSKRSPD